MQIHSGKILGGHHPKGLNEDWSKAFWTKSQQAKHLKPFFLQNLDIWKIANNSSMWTPFMYFENFIVFSISLAVLSNFGFRPP